MGRPINKKYFGTLNNPTSAGSFVVGKEYIITTVGTTNFTLIGATSNTVGVRFRATGAGAGNGVAEGVEPNIPVQAAFIDGEEKFDEGGAQLYIVKQKSARRFVVSSVDDPAQATCKLVNKVYDGSSAVVLAAGEMVIIGYTTGGEAKAIQKISNKVATDFDGVRYKWAVSDDSTTTLLILSSM